jgi:glycosyl transferase family 25
MATRLLKIVVINLPYRRDRRRETEAELRRGGFPDVEFFAAKRPADRGAFGSVGEHGAFLSHKAVHASANCCSDILVLEDDVKFTVSYAALDQLIRRLPPDWEFFYGGHGQLPELKNEWHQQGLVEVGGHAEFVGAHCYAVNGHARHKILSALDIFLTRPRGHPEGGPMPIDGAFNIARRTLALKTFASIPPIAHQRSSRSDIAPLRWFDRAPILRDAAGILRRLSGG